MTAPLLLDLTHTSHTGARTGIQRVTRNLCAALGSRALPICHDPYANAWRGLQPWEKANLSPVGSPGAKRGAHWPVSARVGGRLHRWFGGGATPETNRLPKAHGVLVPEVFSPAVASALPALFAAVPGPRAALFHDAIALKYPELTPPKTVARFPAYLRELLQFDGVAAVSEDSRQSLLEYWEWLGVTNPPPVAAIPLGIDVPGPSEPIRPAGPDQVPVVLSVGSLEGRKNHLALLDACEQLWSAGGSFELRLIGLAQPQTGRAALARLRDLQAKGRPLRYGGPVDDVALEAAYRECAFTVYPSLIEGFGLPVLESLARGKPCICSGQGALGEAARDGGCVTLRIGDATEIAGAIARLLFHPEERQALALAAQARSFKTTAIYAGELLAWMKALSRREPA